MDYKKILEGVVDIINTTEKSDIGFANICTYIGENCPELAESEDERIKREIIDFLALPHPQFVGKRDHEKRIAWLERQRDYDRLIEEMKKRKELLSKEKKKATSANDKLSLGGRIAMLQELLAFNICNTTDKAEPKFKVGDWITDSDINTFQITKIDNWWYYADDDDKACFDVIHDYYHLWTLQDAKEGDILAFDDNTIVIFKDLYNATSFHSYCYIEDGLFGVSKDGVPDWWEGEGFYPTTKEQRDLLFQKMKDAGYEWDSEKKELKKIETHYDIKNFHAGMPVLVRIYNNHKWCYLLFSHCYKHQGILHFSCGGAGWLQCIPFEGNEHLLGTTDMCDEKFINW